jgi:hypothetical protein
MNNKCFLKQGKDTVVFLVMSVDFVYNLYEEVLG